jgi:hypothetical protein
MATSQGASDEGGSLSFLIRMLYTITPIRSNSMKIVQNLRLISIVATLAIASMASADPTTIEWSSTTGFMFSTNKDAIETITGQVAFASGPFFVVEGNMEGRFAYDPAAAQPPQLPPGFAFYPGATFDWSARLFGMSGLIGTVSEGFGALSVSDNGGGTTGDRDVVNANFCCGNTFQVGDWEVLGASVVWIGDGFQDGFGLPETLPPMGAPAPLGVFTVFRAPQENALILTVDVDARVVPSVLAVDIDIKPGSDPNCFNVNGRGVVPVAILGSGTFDVANVDQTTLSFGGLAVRVRGNHYPQCNGEYVNGDGFLDLVCQFEDDAGAWTAGEESATLSGQLLDSTPIEGSDTICLVPKGSRSHGSR